MGVPENCPYCVAVAADDEPVGGWVLREAERVHLVSTRDRVPHFHAWPYPRAANSPLRGTDFLAAAQHGVAGEVERVAEAIRDGSSPQRR